MGLIRQEAERPERLFIVGRELKRGDGLAFLERSLHALDDFELFLCLFAVGSSLLDAGFEAFDAAGDDPKIGEEHFVAKRH